MEMQSEREVFGCTLGADSKNSYEYQKLASLYLFVSSFDIRFHVFAYSVVRCQKGFVQQIKYEQVFYRIVRLFECQ